MSFNHEYLLRRLDGIEQAVGPEWKNECNRPAVTVLTSTILAGSQLVSVAWTAAGFQPVGHLVWAKSYASSSRFLEARHEQAYLLAKGRPTRPSTPLADVRPWVYTGNRVHPTAKAACILTPLVQSFTPRGGLVLDPFAGSGSTLAAAALTGRDYLGIEFEERYCGLARNRLAGVERFMRRKAVA